MHIPREHIGTPTKIRPTERHRETDEDTTDEHSQETSGMYVCIVCLMLRDATRKDPAVQFLHLHGLTPPLLCVGVGRGMFCVSSPSAAAGSRAQDGLRRS